MHQIMIESAHVAIHEIRRAIQKSNRLGQNIMAVNLRGPEWWHECVGRGWISPKPETLFYEVICLQLDHVQDTDATLCHVARLPSLFSLSLSNTQVSDAG